MTYQAKGSSKTKKETIQEITRPGFGEGGTDVWLSVPIRVPDYAVSLEHCTIISIDYTIKVSHCVYCLFHLFLAFFPFKRQFLGLVFVFFLFFYAVPL